MSSTMESADVLDLRAPVFNSSFALDHRLFLSPDFRSTALQTVVLGTLLTWLLVNIGYWWWPSPLHPFLWYLFARLKPLILNLLRAMDGVPGVFDAFGFLSRPATKGEMASKPFGIVNPHLSCYQNSVVQALSSLESLGAYVHYAAAEGETSRALADVLIVLNSNHSRRAVDIFLPPALRKMSVLQEQDAQEYFSVLVEALAKESEASQERTLTEAWGLAGPYPPPPKNPLEGSLLQRLRCTRCGHHDAITRQPFTSLSLSTSSGPQEEEYQSPAKTRGRVIKGTTLQACLSAFTTPERVDGVECRRCTVLHHRRRLLAKLAARRGQGTPRLQRAREKRVRRVERALARGDFTDGMLRRIGLARRRIHRAPKMKQQVVGEAPEALVLHISRSVFDPVTLTQTKDRCRVVIPPVLDLAPWMRAIAGDRVEESTAGGDPGSGSVDGDGDDDMRPSRPADPRRPSPFTYGLRALVDHKGAHHGAGHYVCFRQCAPAPARLPAHYAPAAGTPAKRRQQLRFPGWYLCDDGAVRPAGEADAVDGTAQGEPVLLYYERLSAAERVLAAAASTPAPASEDGDREDNDDDEKGGEEGEVIVMEQRSGCREEDGARGRRRWGTP